MVLGGLLTGLPAHAAGITEPATVFYGRIIRTDAPRPYVVTRGTLNWTIRRVDGTEVTLNAALKPLNGGEFSYRLDVPHEVLSSGLSSTAASVPVGLVDEPALHAGITVNGKPAAIVGDVGTVFSVSQVRRAATHRLDLMVSLDSPDADRNGLPDWWEDQYSRSNPSEDADGDGWNNLAEFRNGSDPNQDNRIPTFETKNVQAYAENTSVLRLQAIDSDSPVAELRYTLETLPESGTLYLRNAVPVGPAIPGVIRDPDRVLTVGANFTQADINQGRFVFVHTASDEVPVPDGFEVSLRDEDPSHPAARAQIALHVYRPSVSISTDELARVLPHLPGTLPDLPGLPAEEWAMTANYLMGREQGFLITDSRRALAEANAGTPSTGLSTEDYASGYVLQYGADRRHLIVGSSGADRLSGGMEADVLIGNGGRDVLVGSGKGDVFLFNSSSGGGAGIEDFSLTDGDVIDVSRLLVGSSTFLSDYVSVTDNGVDSFLGISTNGTRGEYSDYTITVRGTILGQAGLYQLTEKGHLRSGNKELRPLVTISALSQVAGENGPQSGSFVIHRAGDTSAEIQINLMLAGSALNGVDYRLVPTPVRISAGENSATVTVTPIVDALTENAEIVEAVIQAGSGYVVGSSDRAVVTIEDLAVQLRIEAIEPVAVVAGLRAGAFLITRSGLTDRSVLVRLDVTGTAASTTDYEGLPPYITLAANQTTAVISVLPKSTAELTDGTEFVQLGIRSDAAYVVVEPGQSRVIMVDERTTLAEWRQRNFPALIGTLSDFSGADPSRLGIRNLQRYAFGLDPVNPRDTNGIPSFRIQGGRLTVDFRQPAAVQDVLYVVEVSDDLVRWDSGPAYVDPVARPAGNVEADRVSFQAKRPANDPRPCFMRVRVTLVP